MSRHDLSPVTSEHFGRRLVGWEGFLCVAPLPTLVVGDLWKVLGGTTSASNHHQRLHSPFGSVSSAAKQGRGGGLSSREWIP